MLGTPSARLHAGLAVRELSKLTDEKFIQTADQTLNDLHSDVFSLKMEAAPRSVLTEGGQRLVSRDVSSP